MREYCKEIADMLVDYADGQLSAEESTRVTAHLAECDDCRTLLNVSAYSGTKSWPAAAGANSYPSERAM